MRPASRAFSDWHCRGPSRWRPRWQLCLASRSSDAALPLAQRCGRQPPPGVRWKAGTAQFTGRGEAETVSFCLPLVPRDLSVCSVFFLGGEKRKIFVDHRVRAAEEAELHHGTFSCFRPCRAATSPVLVFVFSCCDKHHATDSLLHLPKAVWGSSRRGSLVPGALLRPRCPRLLPFCSSRPRVLWLPG